MSKKKRGFVDSESEDDDDDITESWHTPPHLKARQAKQALLKQQQQQQQQPQQQQATAEPKGMSIDIPDINPNEQGMYNRKIAMHFILFMHIYTSSEIIKNLHFSNL